MSDPVGTSNYGSRGRDWDRGRGRGRGYGRGYGRGKSTGHDRSRARGGYANSFNSFSRNASTDSDVESVHPTTRDPKPSRTHQYPQASDNVVAFLRRVTATVNARNPRFLVNNPRDLDLWRQAWSALSVGAQPGSISNVLRLFMRLPAKKSLSPPAIIVWRTLHHLCKHLPQENTAAVVTSLELVTDVIEHRLMDYDLSSSCSTEAFEIRGVAHTSLLQAVAVPSQARSASRLMLRILNLLEQYINECSRISNTVAASSEDNPAASDNGGALAQPSWAGWRAPTVGWLRRGEWLNAPQLLSEYPDIPAYTDATRQFVTMLTFYWGAGALFPRCRLRGPQADYNCDQPLLQKITSTRAPPCSSRSCNSPATWRCSRHGHDALCQSCLRGAQNVISGEPSRRSSTDIYDAVVERETIRREGVVYHLSNVASRRPPIRPPDWRTTYRLNCSAFVAVVRLAVSGEPLHAHAEINWAEIVPVKTDSKFGEDYSQRALGRLALRLLTRADLSTLQGDADTIPIGSRVAVIDLQVFVPEVISVLSALGDPSLERHLSHIPFFSNLIGSSVPGDPVHVNDDINSMVNTALSSSELDVITRLSDTNRLALGRSLVNLAKESFLSGTQLTAFADALKFGLHCTQGPPGTGKSYLGVVLIRALDLIRTVAAKANVHVGPIVVMSYKNHALDEILRDVLDKSRMSPGSLIRCGKPEDESLLPFVERSTKLEHYARTILIERVSSMRSIRRYVRDLNSLYAAFKDGTGYSLHTWAPNRKGNEHGLEVVKTWVYRALCLLTFKSEGGEDLSCERAYSILMRAISPDPNLETTEQLALVQSISQVLQNVEHWHNPPHENRSFFLLGKWLEGGVPPPRCAAVDDGPEGCLLACEKEGGFCIQVHRCLYISGCELRRVGRIRFCAEHRCDTHDCEHPQISNARFCERHACGICIEFNHRPVMSRIGEACELHSCHEEACDKGRANQLIRFCPQHACQSCLHSPQHSPGSVRSGLRVRDSLFCIDHKCCENTCLRRRIPGIEQQYCHKHACSKCDGFRKLVDPILPSSKLCPDHRCAFFDIDIGPCAQSRCTSSHFCPSHTCRFCKEDGLPLDQPALDYEPRNACARHPPCQFVSFCGDQCNERASSAHSRLCSSHLKESNHLRGAFNLPEAVMQCEGTTTKNKRCKATGRSDSAPFFCRAHFGQKPSLHSDPELNQTGHVHSAVANDTYVRPESGIWTRVPGPYPSASQASDGESQGNQGIDAQTSESRDSVANHDLTDDESSESDVTLSLTDDSRSTNTSDSASEDAFTNLEQDDDGDHRNDCAFDIVGEKVTGVVPNSNQGSDDEAGGGEMYDVPVLACVSEAAKLEDTNINPQDRKNAEDEICREGNATDVDLSYPDLSSDSNENEAERHKFGTCPDELNMSSSSSESESVEELPDQLQHLQDIVDHDSVAGSESDEEDPPTQDNTSEIDASCCDLGLWTWTLPLQDRRNCAAVLIREVMEFVSQLATLAEPHVDNARQSVNEAAADSFKRSRIIGATVVGATRRLHAIRASEPFAMIVEEACEVMEPTLLSVLSVRSLRKLELIGDHRQLPAFVQHCWFPIQTTHPSIKVSLFERLMQSGTATHAVLDIQRRMRPEICDLTRCEYTDVVEIVDDNVTSSQLVADRYLKSNCSRAAEFRRERELWHRKGEVVPGVSPQVFFWDIESKEGRAAVGMSRCNNTEASLCVGLVKWFMRCSVPAECITVITPFKGQKITIMKLLRKVLGYNASRGVFVSTVDRYQGDENDIIILSLVSTRPGNRFVALRNRFIVSTSRARLGFYIIGSSGAVTKSSSGGEGPSHWRRLLKDLSGDNFNRNECQDRSARAARIGASLPICCPRHEFVVKSISSAEEFPASPEELKSFCTEPCPYIIPWCGHSCDHPCHSSAESDHSTKCLEAVDRPCSNHPDVPLLCNQVRHCTGEVQPSNLKDALLSFQCDVTVHHRRKDCPHVVHHSCHYQQLLDAGDRSLDACTESVEDYVNPSCGHVIQGPKCYLRRKWEAEPPQCMIVVSHERVCGCKTKMLCHESVRESSLESPPLCLEAVARPRPRCTHKLSSRCCDATRLQHLFNNADGVAVTGNPIVIKFGVRYGPSETDSAEMDSQGCINKIPLCLKKSVYQRSCGHEMKVQCAEGFKLALGILQESECQTSVFAKSPLCGHDITVPCAWKSVIDTLSKSVFCDRVDSKTDEVEKIADEDQLDGISDLHPIVKKLSHLCNRSFIVRKSCGHLTKPISCSILFSILNGDKLPLCTERYPIVRSCGHTFVTQCYKQGEPLPECNEIVGDEFLYPFCRHGHSVHPGTCGKLTQMRKLINPLCHVRVYAVRWRCGHATEVPCHLENNVTRKLPGGSVVGEEFSSVTVVEEGVDYCEAATDVPNCTETVSFQRSCGHEELDVPCARAFEWASGILDLPDCVQDVEVISPVCGHPVLVECHRSEELVSMDPWEGDPPPRITLSIDENGELTSPVMSSTRVMPDVFRDLTTLKCGHTTRLIRACGHEDDIDCCSIFLSKEAPCERIEVIPCTDCGYKQEVPCHLASSGTLPHCTNRVEKLCNICGVNFTKGECYLERAICDSDVSITLPCGHPLVWECGEEDPRCKADSVLCLNCLENDMVVALKKAEAAKDSESIAELFGSEQLKCDMYNQMKITLGDFTIQTEILVERIDVDSLRKAYIKLLQTDIDLINSALINNTRDDVAWNSKLVVTDRESSYDIIFIRVSAKDDAIIFPQMLQGRDTVYGTGVSAQLLNTDSLVAAYEMDKQSTLRIVIGIALRHRALKGVEPFRASRGDLTNPDQWKNEIKAARKEATEKIKRSTAFKQSGGKKRRKLSKAQKIQQKKDIDEAAREAEEKVKTAASHNAMRHARIRADNMRRNLLWQGYDHVECVGDLPLSRVYWNIDAVVPLALVDLQMKRDCMICMDEFTNGNGWVCDHDHFLCRGCFKTHVAQASQPGALERSVDEDGRVKCPYDGCDVAYKMVALVAQNHGATSEELNEVMGLLEKLRMSKFAKREVNLALEQQKSRMQAEFERIQKIQDVNQRRAETLRLEIVEKVLTLRCPREQCGAAFDDFDGCFALSCHACHANFCAWCVSHWTIGDVHGHVALCKESLDPGQMYSTKDKFSQRHRQKRRAKVIALLQEEGKEVQAKALECLEKNLRDLDIYISIADI